MSPSLVIIWRTAAATNDGRVMGGRVLSPSLSRQTVRDKSMDGVGGGLGLRNRRGGTGWREKEEMQRQSLFQLSRANALTK